jgi:bifunctional non-homologous end joining protein LigD
VARRLRRRLAVASSRLGAHAHHGRGADHRSMNRPLVDLPLLAPMLATASTRLPPHLEQWAAEVKWDGMRVASYLDGTGGLRLLTRGGNPAADRFPELEELTELLPGIDAVFDGEVIATGPDGRPSFGRLQERMGLRRPQAVRAGARNYPVTLMLFDILWLRGRSLIDMTYRGRREVLEDLSLAGTRIAVPPAWPGTDADQALEWTADQGLEGVVLKRLGGVYEPGARSSAWLKIKHAKSLDIVIGGWVPAGTSVKALLLGVRDGADLRYVGKVGSGLSDAERKALVGLFDHISADRSPFTAGPALPRAEPVRFVRPEVTGEVDYLETTNTGVLRQPVWRGLRTKNTE